MTGIWLIAGVLLLAWLAVGVLAFFNGIAGGRAKPRWALICLAAAPVALYLSHFPAVDERRRPAPPRRKYQDEDFFKRSPPFSYEVRQLKRQKRYEEAEEVLLVLLDEVERRARRMGREIPIWYHQQLASVYKAQGEEAKKAKVWKRREKFGG